MERKQFERIMTKAIEREMEAHWFCLDVAKGLANWAIKDVSQRLAGEELQHRDMLENLRSRPPTVVFAPSSLDVKITEVTPLPKLSRDMMPAEAIALAMKKEQDAVEFYRTYSARATDDAHAEQPRNRPGHCTRATLAVEYV